MTPEKKNPSEKQSTPEINSPIEPPKDTAILHPPHQKTKIFDREFTPFFATMDFLKQFSLRNIIPLVACIVLMTLLHIAGNMILDNIKSTVRFFIVSLFIFPYVIAITGALCSHHFCFLLLTPNRSLMKHNYQKSALKFVLFACTITTISIISILLLGFLNGEGGDSSFLSFFCMMGLFSMISATIYAQFGFILPASCAGHNFDPETQSQDIFKRNFIMALFFKVIPITVAFVLIFNVEKYYFSYIISSIISSCCFIYIHISLAGNYILSGEFARNHLNTTKDDLGDPYEK